MSGTAKPASRQSLDSVAPRAHAWLRSLLPLTSFRLLTACAVDRVEIVGEPVWSDDDEEVAFAAHFYEVPRRQIDEAPSDQKRKHSEYQYFRIPADLSEDATPIGQRRHDTGELYFMRTAGYLLASAKDSDTITILRIGLDGDERVVANSDDWPSSGALGDNGAPSLLAAPSPDGRHLAVWSEVDSGSAPKQSFHFHVKIIDIEDPTVDLAAFDIAGQMALVWTPEGSAVCSGETGAFAWHEGESAFMPTVSPTCLWPRTTSSSVSSDGRIIVAGDSLEEPFRFDAAVGVPGMPNVPFGCM